MVLKKKIILPKLLKKKLFSAINRKYLILGSAIFAIFVFFYFTKSLFIAAIVNGKPITRLALVKSLEKQGGQQALDGLVTKELIGQEAKKKGINVTDAEVTAEVDRIRKVVEAQGSSLEATLAFQGQTLKDLEENLYLKINVERIFGSEVSVSEEEISNYYEANKTLFSDQKLEDVSGQIKDQLLQEKLGTKFSEWITEVKNNSKIKYLVSF